MFAVLHVADFPLHAVLRLDPTVRGQPAALFSGTGKKSVVMTTTAAARAAGVWPGMTAPQAVARCPALIIRSPDVAAEGESRATQLAVALTLSPAVEDTAPGVCTIDLKGADTSRPKPLRLAITRLAHHGLPATAGLARTPLLALYAARATDSVLRVDDERHFLSPLPLATADPSPELAAVFTDWGLRTLGDFIALPRDEIVRRFGAVGLALWQRATGGDVRPLRLVSLPQTFSAAHELEEPIETLEPLLFLLRRFLDRLALELLAAQLVAAEIELTLRLDDDSCYTRSFRLPEPSADADILLRALHTHLESLQTAAPICSVQVRLAPTRPLVRQQGLFETGLRDPHGFAETLARVVALVGSDRVGTPQLVDTHRPDAVKLIPPLPVVPPPAPPPLHAPLGAPLRRFRPPVPAQLSAVGDGAVFLWSERVRGEISFRGPAYPLSGEWWQADRAWSRREFDVEVAGGGVYRLSQIDGNCFIEGEYD